MNNSSIQLLSDLLESFVDMCSNDEQMSKTNKHIVLNRSEQTAKECRCFINHGKFSVMISDLRLHSKFGNMSSSSTLMVNTQTFSGGHQDDDNIFNRPLEESLSNAFVALKINGILAPPFMIWLTVIPNGE